EDVPARVDRDPSGGSELPERGAEGAHVRERLDADIRLGRDPHVSERIDSKIIERSPIEAELSVPVAANPGPTPRRAGLQRWQPVRPAPAEGEEEGSVIPELLDAVVAVLSHEHVPAPIHRHAFRCSELPGSAARAAPRGDKRSCLVELLDA